MSFLFGNRTQQGQPQPLVANVDASRVGTNQETRPVPYIAGTNRIGLTWITPAFNVKTVAVTENVGGSVFGQTVTTGYNYYSDLVGLIAYGPLDAITQIWYDSVLAWEGSIVRGAEDFIDIVPTLQVIGTIRLYWGKPFQEVDPALTLLGHPPYRGYAYVYCKRLFYGENTTSAPNLEFVVKRIPTALRSFGAEINGDANPADVIYELAQHPFFGAKIPARYINRSRFLALADELEEIGLGISPMLTSYKNFVETLADIMEYFNGFMVIETSGPDLVASPGQLSVYQGITPADFNSCPIVTADDCISNPKLSSDSMFLANTQVNVQFTDRDRQYKSDGLVNYHDAGNFLMSGGNQPQTLDRKWITNQQTAQMLCDFMGRAAALPQTTGTVEVTLDIANWVVEGGIFTLEPYKGADQSIWLDCRCIKKTRPEMKALTATLEFALDRTREMQANYNPASYVAVQPVVYDVAPFNVESMIEVPKFLVPAGGLNLTALLQRPDALITGYQLNRSSDGTNYYVLGQGQGFACEGTLSTAALYNDSSIAVLMADTSQLADIGIEGSGIEADLMLVVFQNEIMCVTAVTIVDATHVTLTVTRGRMDTASMPHAINEACFIISRTQTTYMTDPTFVEGENWYAKAQSKTLHNILDIADANMASGTWQNRPACPITPDSLTINTQTTLACTGASGTDETFGWANNNWNSKGYASALDFYSNGAQATVIQIWDSTFTTLKRTITTSAGATSATYAHATRNTDFGSAPYTYGVRVFSSYGGRLSYCYQQRTIAIT